MPTASTTTSNSQSTNPKNKTDMSKSRIKVAAPTILTRDEAEAVLNDLALTANNKRTITARMDAELLAIQKNYQPALTECDDAINAKAKQLEAWADAHPEIFPKNRKSVAMLAGTIGFRTDTPSLVLLNRSFSWAKVLASITAARWRKFIRTKVEVDKDAILARSGTLEKPTRFQRTTLPELGLKIVQAENFFVEPNLTDAKHVETK